MEKSPGDDSQVNKSQRRLHKKKKDVMLSPKKPPNAWTAFLNEKLQEVSYQLYQVALIANEPAERRRSAGEAAENSAARRMAYAKKFSIEL